MITIYVPQSCNLDNLKAIVSENSQRDLDVDILSDITVENGDRCYFNQFTAPYSIYCIEHNISKINCSGIHEQIIFYRTILVTYHLIRRNNSM